MNNQTEFEEVWSRLKEKASQSKEAIITDNTILDKDNKQIWRFKR